MSESLYNPMMFIDFSVYVVYTKTKKGVYTYEQETKKCTDYPVNRCHPLVLAGSGWRHGCRLAPCSCLYRDGCRLHPAAAADWCSRLYRHHLCDPERTLKSQRCTGRLRQLHDLAHCLCLPLFARLHQERPRQTHCLRYHQSHWQKRPVSRLRHCFQ